MNNIKLTAKLISLRNILNDDQYSNVLNEAIDRINNDILYEIHVESGEWEDYSDIIIFRCLDKKLAEQKLEEFKNKDLEKIKNVKGVKNVNTVGAKVNHVKILCHLM